VERDVGKLDEKKLDDGMTRFKCSVIVRASVCTLTRLLCPKDDAREQGPSGRVSGRGLKLRTVRVMTEKSIAGNGKCAISWTLGYEGREAKADDFNPASMGEVSSRERKIVHQIHRAGETDEERRR
jgi:hypothetical protein